MRRIYSYSLAQLLFLLVYIYQPVFSQTSGSLWVDGGPDVNVCAGQCTTLTATVQGAMQTTAYTGSAIAYTPYSFTAGTVVLNNIDDRYSPAINMPFCFQFFGNTYNQVIIGSNGVITFNTAYANTASGYSICGAIPTTCGSTPRNAIMTPYHDIDPSVPGNTADLRYATYGTAPFRVFVISFYNCPMFSGACNGNAALNATQQVVLHENTNIIDIFIQNKQLCSSWNGGYAIEGIQNAAGTVGYAAPGRNYPTQWTAVNDGYRFTPSGAPNYTIQWLDPSNNVLSTTNTVTVCPTVATTYQVRVTNNTCSGAVVVNDFVNVGISSPTVTAGNGGGYCPGQTIGLTASAGGTVYNWTGPNGYVQNNVQNPTISNATAAMAGVYTVTMTNAAGCTATATTIVAVSSPTATASNTGPYCAGSTIALSAPAGGTVYNWTGPGGYSQPNTQNPTRPSSTVAMSGVYTVTVTYPGGCTATGTTSVVVNPVPAPAAGNTGPYCAGQTIGLTATGGTGYNWIGPNGYVQNNVQNPTIPSSTIAMGGIYTVTVTNGSGCSATATTSVIVNSAPMPVASNTGPYCAGSTIQLNSPLGGPTDDWTGPAGYNQLNLQNPSISSSTIAMSGIYTVTVTNAAGCSATATTSVTVNALPVPVAGNTGPYCAGSTIQLSSPTGSSTDDWTGPSGYNQLNTQNPSIVSSTTAMSGIYTVTVTNAGGCSATATTNVVVNALPAPTATNTGPYCAGATIQLNSPAGSVTDDWTGPAGYSQLNTQNPIITSSTIGMSGVYTVTVTNASGCSATATTSVFVNSLPVATATNTGPYCAGVTIQLNSPGGSATDDWTGPNSYTQNNIQNPVIPSSSVAMSGIYTVTVTNAAGCSSTATTTVVVNSLPIANATNTGPYCAGNTISLNTGPGSTDWDWVGPNGYVASNIQNPNIGSATPSMTGMYTVTVTNANGCSATGSTSVVVNFLPTPTASNTGPYCAGSVIQLNSPNGNSNDDWSGPNAFVQNNMQNPTIVNSNALMSGVYTVTVTNNSNCSATATTTVVVNSLPNVTAGNNSPVCEFQNITLNSNGGVDYDWTGPGGYTNPNTQNPVIVSATSANAGIYTVTVTDANGCVSTATTSLSINLNLSFNASSNSAICAGATLTLTADNIPAATYNWTGPGNFSATNQQNPTIPSSTTAATGTYTVLATNSSGCTGTATVNVVVNALPAVLFAGDNLAGCSPVCVNFSDQTTMNGSTIASWSWNVESQTNSNAQNPSYCFNNPGQYDASLTVTTADGCANTFTLTDYITVGVPPAASFDFAPDEIFFSDPEVSFGSTSIGAASWNWDFGDGTTGVGQNPVHVYPDTGEYCVLLTVTNQVGCTDTALGCLFIKPVFSIYIPNSFSPNGDGLNESWNIYGNDVNSISVRIFDRWGEEIFSFDDISKGWPGTKTNAQPCMQGVYVYRIELVDTKNDFYEYTGTVNLIR